jgi:molybdopterin synthase sulfur carrier subunit
MSVLVRIPAQIRRLYGAQAREELEADTVAAMIAALDARYPGMRERLTEPDGQLRRWVNVFVDGRDIRTQEGLATPLQPGAEVYIVPSVAGGALLSPEQSGLDKSRKSCRMRPH